MLENMLLQTKSLGISYKSKVFTKVNLENLQKISQNLSAMQGKLYANQ
jgi:hypothetical protein